jgi:hypothetical protein
MMWVNLAVRHGGGLHSGRVHRVAELLAGLEEGHTLGRDVDFFPSLGVAADAGVTLTGPETAEAANLNLIAGLERADDGLEEGVNDNLSIASGEVTEGGYFIDKVSFSHWGGPFVLGKALWES